MTTVALHGWVDLPLPHAVATSAHGHTIEIAVDGLEWTVAWPKVLREPYVFDRLGPPDLGLWTRAEVHPGLEERWFHGWGRLDENGTEVSALALVSRSRVPDDIGDAQTKASKRIRRMADWCAIASGPLAVRFRSVGPFHFLAEQADGDAYDAAGQLVRVQWWPTQDTLPLRPRHLRAAAELASDGAVAPLGRLLFVRADHRLRRGDHAGAVLDAAPALENALTTFIKDEAARAAPGVGRALTRQLSRAGLGRLRTVANDIAGGPLVEDLSDESLVRMRNAVVHDGVRDPDPAEVRRLLLATLRVLDIVEPIPKQLQGRPAEHLRPGC